jgi:hypothetical protein
MIILFLLVLGLQNCCFGKYNDPIRLPIKKLLNFYPEFADSVLKRSEMYNLPFSSPLASRNQLLLILVLELVDTNAESYYLVIDTGLLPLFSCLIS